MQRLQTRVLRSSRSKKFGKGLVGSVETLRPVRSKWPGWDRENDRQTEWMQTGRVDVARLQTVSDRLLMRVGQSPRSKKHRENACRNNENVSPINRLPTLRNEEKLLSDNVQRPKTRVGQRATTACKRRTVFPDSKILSKQPVGRMKTSPPMNWPDRF
jgi:hypothetical protein